MKTRLKKENMIQCNQCGGIWTDNSNLCGSCEQIRQSNHYNKLVKIGIIAGLSVGAVICAGTGISYAADSQKLQQSELNPVIHSSEDITDDLLQRILDNSIDSLTIDYEFTKCDNAPYDPEIIDKIKSSNPFWRANNIRPLQHIKFEVKLTSNVHSLDCAFEYLNKLEYVNLKVTSNVTSMRGMFKYSVLFNQPIGDWNTSKVTNMREMFRNAKSFNQPIGNWDTSNVTDMECMFCWAESFNQPIGNWNTSNVTNMSYMFTMTSSFNQPIGNWDTSNVIDPIFADYLTQNEESRIS